MAPGIEHLLNIDLSNISRGTWVLECFFLGGGFIYVVCICRTGYLSEVISQWGKHISLSSDDFGPHVCHHCVSSFLHIRIQFFLLPDSDSLTCVYWLLVCVKKNKKICQVAYRCAEHFWEVAGSCFGENKLCGFGTVHRVPVQFNTRSSISGCIEGISTLLPLHLFLWRVNCRLLDMALI